jgi:RNA polymerase sigma factor (sigma-70 family)
MLNSGVPMPAFQRQAEQAMPPADVEARCAMIIAGLSVEMSWALSGSTQHAYSRVLAQYLPNPCSDEYARQVVIRYHQDHLLVDALMDPLHVGHEVSWASWVAQVVPILRNVGLAWSDDPAIDPEDLAQIARAELARALPTFRYASRFSTWAHQVIARSVQRYLRDRLAGKRAGRPISLETVVADELPSDGLGQPELAADASVLAALVDDILRAQPDRRLAVIFQLWAIADVRVEEIGRRLQISPSQDRALLGRIRQILQSEPAIRAWREDGAPIP